MTPDQLAEKLVAHPRWRALGISVRPSESRSNEGMIDGPTGYPDLTDAATAGVLVGLLDPSGMRGITICRERDGTWWVDTYTAATLGEATARALLASWGQE